MPPYHSVFLSHAHRDNEICTAIAERLQARGIDVWLDLNDAQQGNILTKEIESQIDSRSAFILMYTAASRDSFWVQLEQNAFLGRRAQDDSLLFLPVRLEPIALSTLNNAFLWIDAVGKSSDALIEEIIHALDRSRTSAPLAAAPFSSFSSVPTAPEMTPSQALTPAPMRPYAPAPPPAWPLPQFAPDGIPIHPRMPPHRAAGTWSRRGFLAMGGLAVVGAAIGGYAWWSQMHTGSSHTSSQESAKPTATSLPSFVPATLAKLGFAGQVVNGQQVIVPPTASIPAGSFLMGSNPAVDPNAKADETPQGEIVIDQAYAMGIYPLTVAEYALAVIAGVVPIPVHNVDPTLAPWTAQMQHPDHPVVNVSWFDAKAYALWLATLTGKPWRLPTEPEWEKAARGTDGRIYPWGNQWDPQRANTNDGGPGSTTTIGQYAAQHDDSPYHLHDMAGNVFTWCSTIYDQSRFPYPWNPSDGRENPSDGTSNHIVRGGAWSRSPIDARTAGRGWDLPSFRHDLVGIRLAFAM